MKAINPGIWLLPFLTTFLMAPVLADDATEAAPASAVTAATAEVAPMPPAFNPGMSAYPVWQGGTAPMAMPTVQLMPYVPGLAGRVMFMPVWMQPMPGMPAVLNWFPVILAPVQALPGLPLPQADSVDYGPVSDTPVIELPLPEELNSQPTEEPEATNDPESPPAAEDASAAAQMPIEIVATEDAADMLSASADPPWTEPAVDYGPVTATPVVDMLELEKKLSTPPVRTKKRSSSNSPPPAKPAAAPKKNRMCWENGIVAPCK